MRILGIDNGLDGGLVMLEGTRIVGKLVMPTIKAPNGKGREYDVQTILATLDSWRPELACIEKAQAMPGQGVTSMFSIGKGFGLMLGILAARALPHEIVHPRTWQKVIFTDLSKEDTKAASVLIAKRLWPSTDWRATERSRNAHDGLTDAACIAEYGRRRF